MQIPRNASTLLVVAFILAGAGGLAAADGAAADPLPKDWPNWRGPYCSGEAVPCGEPLVDDLRKARLLWVSEEDIPSNYYSGGRHGSYGSPIIGELRPDSSRKALKEGARLVFMNYQYGKGTNRRKTATAIREGGDAVREVFETDYVVVALDALTGKTVWRTVVDRGPNMSMYSGNAMHVAPCYYRGRVYAQSNLGRVYCLDAASGEVLWQADSYQTANWLKVQEICRTAKVMPRHGRPPKELADAGFGNIQRFTHPVMVADGVVIAFATPRLDAQTGAVLGPQPHLDPKRLAQIEKGELRVRDDVSAPVRWAVGGKEYIIKGARCYEPRSGKKLWLEKRARSGRAPAVGSGYQVSAVGGRPGAKMNCFAISTERAEHRWLVAAPEGCGLGGSFPGAIADGWYYAKLPWKSKKMASLIAVELATGKMLEPLEVGPNKSGIPAPVISDGRIFYVITHGETFGVHMAERNGDALRILPGFLGRRDFGIAHVYTPAIADGRLYVRTERNIKCFDLRAANALKDGESNPVEAKK